MSWLQFIDSMIGHLAWPVVVLIVIVAIRKQLASLTERILELSFGGATVKFGKLLSKGAEIIEDAPPKIAPPAKDEPELPLIASTELRKLPIAFSNSSGESVADVFRRLAHRTKGVVGIYVAFEAIETELDQLGEELGVKTRDGLLVRMLEKRSLISPDVRELYNTLRLGRDFIVYGRSSPNEEQISEYVRQSIYLLDNLQIALKTLKESKNKKPSEGAD
jgi:hypothetical protein